MKEKMTWFCFFILFFTSCQGPSRKVNTMNHKNKDVYAKKRKEMVERQIMARGVKDTLVLDAMLKVPRHHFVPDHLHRFAYADEPLPIGHNQTISQPYIVAYMTEVLGLTKNDKVLEIGTGSGYQAAILGEIVKKVYTIEIVEPLARSAEETLKNEGYENIFCLHGDGYQGWPEEAPFDAIMVTAAPPQIPESLVRQLKIGGRMVLPVGEWFQELVLVTKKKDKIEHKRLIPVRFVPMTGKIQREKHQEGANQPE